MKTRKQRIEDTISDLVMNFLYHNRKEDESLPVGAIEEAIETGEITVDWIVAEFAKHMACLDKDMLV